MQGPSGGAPRSPDGQYWWDGGRWRPVRGSGGRRRADWRVRVSLVLIGLLLVAGIGGGVVLGARVLARPKAARPEPATVTFQIPPGFVEDNHDYQIAVPLYRHRTTRWARPTDEPVGLDVIFVNSYLTPDNARGESAQRVRNRIAAYDQEVSAVHVTRPLPTRVDHRGAWTQYISQPLAGSTGVAMYESTYVFVGRDLVQIGCQWQREQPEVMTGCRVVLRTLRISS